MNLLVSKLVAAVFTLLGGVFDIFGSVGGVFLGVLAFGMFGILGSVSNPSGYQQTQGMDGLGFILGPGILTGVLIMVGGALLNSDHAQRRKSGGISAVAMMVIGALPTLSGFLIGFVLARIGSVLGRTHNPGAPDVVIGLGDVGADLERGDDVDEGVVERRKRSTLSYCIKCREQLYEGAAFCGVCGAEIPS